MGKGGVARGPERSDKGAAGWRITLVDNRNLMGPPFSCDSGALAALRFAATTPFRPVFFFFSFEYASKTSLV